MKNVLLEHLYHKPLLNPDELYEKLMEYKEMVAPYVCDVSLFLHKAMKNRRPFSGRPAGLVKGPGPRYLSDGDIFLHFSGVRSDRCRYSAI